MELRDEVRPETDNVKLLLLDERHSRSSPRNEVLRNAQWAGNRMGTVPTYNVIL